MIAVHFGAGNIGRGFIGLLLNQAGMDVCFVDVDKTLVEEINKKKEYTVMIADANEASIRVRGVRAIDGNDVDAVIEQIVQADLITTAVGPNILKYIAPVLAQGISKRLSLTDKPLNIIACENMIGGSSQLKSFIFEALSDAEKEKADVQIGFPDSAVDRIVPIQKNNDPLLVRVEPFYEWIIDESAIVGEPEKIPGAIYVQNLSPYIERKLFTVNTGHAIAAYLGYQFGHQTITQAMNDGTIFEITKRALEESGAVLVHKHGFDPQQHQEYIEKILKRFLNPCISDDVTRVGRSPIRKLSATDRLVGPAVQAIKYGIEPQHLALGIAAAFRFDYAHDPEAVALQTQIKEQGIKETIRNITGLAHDHVLFTMILQQLERLEHRKIEL
jgi:mannitol-1-phosphate 5-dehydrogenase